MNTEVSVVIDVDIVDEYGYQFKAPYEASVAPEYDYEYTYYSIVFDSYQTAHMELMDEYNVYVIYVDGVPWILTVEQETIVNLYADEILLKEYSTLTDPAIIRINIFKQ